MSQEKKEGMLAFALSQVRQILQDAYTTEVGLAIIFFQSFWDMLWQFQSGMNKDEELTSSDALLKILGFFTKTAPTGLQSQNTPTRLNVVVSSTFLCILFLRHSY